MADEEVPGHHLAVMPRARPEKVKAYTSAVRCPHCGYAYSELKHGRQQKRGYRRRRVCLRCSRGFITYEVTAIELNRLAAEGGAPFMKRGKGKKHAVEVRRGCNGVSSTETGPNNGGHPQGDEVP